MIVDFVFIFVVTTQAVRSPVGSTKLLHAPNYAPFDSQPWRGAHVNEIPLY